MNSRTLLAALAALGLSAAAMACSSATVDPQASGDGAETAVTSEADHTCRIVTRSSAESTRNGTPWEISVDANGTSWFVWRGEVDVAATETSTGNRVMVTWSHNVEGDQNVWRTAQAVAVSGAGVGYQRYEFALTYDTFGAGDDGYSYGQLDLQFIPYVQRADGSRLFDHNRTDGNYNMNKAFDYRVTADDSVCPAAAVTDAG